jgi:polar amino acid transport system permease protein
MSYQNDWTVLWQYRGALVQAALLTVELSLLAMVLSLVAGTAVGVMRTAPAHAVRALALLYVEVMRNIPSLVKLFFFYFAFGMGAFTATVVALTLHQAAYIAEAVRAGVQSLPRGQTEAALASGLSMPQTLTAVILPQTFRIILPPLITNFIEIIKNSSIGVTVGLAELTFQTQLINSETFRGFEAATAVTVAYLVMTLGTRVAMVAVERRLRYRI